MLIFLWMFCRISQLSHLGLSFSLNVVFYFFALINNLIPLFVVSLLMLSIYSWVSFSCLYSLISILYFIISTLLFIGFFSAWFEFCLQFFFQCLKVKFRVLIWFFFLIYLFWLHWVFVAAHGLSLVAASGGYPSWRCAGFSLRWPLLLRSTGSRREGSVVVARGL